MRIAAIATVLFLTPALAPLASVTQETVLAPEAAMTLEDARELVGDSPNRWAYARYTAGLGRGHAQLTCESPVEVGTVVDEAVLTFTAGEGGIAPGGQVSVWFPVGATPPQFDEPDARGHVAIDSPVPHEASTEMVWFSRQHKQHANERQRLFVVTKLPDGLEEGQELTYTYRNAGVGSQARRWHGDEWRFRVYVDHDADGWEEEIPRSPRVPKVPAEAVGLVVRAQSTATVGEPVRLVVEAVDGWRNAARFYRGEVSFSAESGEGLPAPYRFSEQDGGAHTFTCRFEAPGVYWVAVSDEASGFRSASNPIEVLAEAPEYRLYWGDLHVHTEMSADAINWAQSTPRYDGAYEIGRHRAGLDFMAVTDHQGHAAGSYTPRQWEDLMRITNAANDPGAFVTLIGIEMSHGKGDQNVYFAGAHAPFLPRGPEHPHELWTFLRDYDCFTVPHHVAQSMRPWDWRNYDEELMPVVEIFSNHGRAEFHGNEPHYSHHPKATIEGRTWRDQLDAGRTIGCIAASDDHTGIPGMVGLAAVWAKELTREAIFRNIKQRHCYASSNGRTILRFSVNGAPMGSVLPAGGGKPVLKVWAATHLPIKEVTIIRNGEDVYTPELSGRLVDLTWEDEGYAGGDAYYYVRIRTEGAPNYDNFFGPQDQFAWSSPVWLRE